jgi:outer membrane protein
MRKLILLATLFALVLSASALMAQGQAANQTTATKMAFVNSYEVLNGTEEGRQGLERLNNLMQQKQEDFNTQKSELDKLREQFAAQERTLNPETRSEMQRSMEERDRRLARFQEDAQMEINRERDELLGRVSEKAQEIINDYAQKNGFGVVFLYDPRMLAFLSPALDITEEVIKLYNAGAASASAPAAPPAAPPATPTP